MAYKIAPASYRYKATYETFMQACKNTKPTTANTQLPAHPPHGPGGTHVHLASQTSYQALLRATLRRRLVVMAQRTTIHGFTGLTARNISLYICGQISATPLVRQFHLACMTFAGPRRLQRGGTGPQVRSIASLIECLLFGWCFYWHKIIFATRRPETTTGQFARSHRYSARQHERMWSPTRLK